MNDNNENMNDKSENSQSEQKEFYLSRVTYYLIYILSIVAISAAEFVASANHRIWNWHPKYFGLYFLVVGCEIYSGMLFTKDRQISLMKRSLILAILVPIITFLFLAAIALSL